jgi:ribosomal protein L11 methyltransferase
MRVRAPGAELAERLIAEAWEAGALGVEEVAAEAAGGEIGLIVYLPRAAEEGMRSALSRFAGEGAEIGSSEPIEPVDWVESWKEGMQAIEISPRLVVRASFVEHRLRAGQKELVVDPGQAFGTGGHASTGLALEWIDVLMADPERAPDRVLDVGTGTAVLAQAALKLGASSAVGFDLDRNAVREAGRGAQANGVAESLQLFSGPISALRAEPFDLVVANLLKREVLPIADAVARSVRPGGLLVLSGLLVADREEIRAAFAACGLVVTQERRLLDSGGDDWISPLLQRVAA